MNNAGQKIVVGGMCRPDGAWSVCVVLATKMTLLAELGGSKNGAWFLKCFSVSAFLLLTQVCYSQDIKTNAQTNLPVIEQSLVSEKSNQPIVVQLVDTSNRSVIKEILNSPVVSAMIGLLGALGGFFIADCIKSRNLQREKNRKYKAALWSARHELIFYSKQLKELAELMETAVPLVNELQNGTVKPSSTVYPIFLEQQKNEICALSKNHELVLKIVECHYNLCHIKEKLVFLNEYKVEPNQKLYFAASLGSLGSLAKSCVPLFEDTAKTLAAEAESI